MKGFCFSFLKTVLFVVCFLSVLLPGMGGPTEGADPLEVRSKDKELTDEEKKDAGILYNEFGQEVGYEETEVNKDGDKIKKEKGKDSVAKGKPPEKGVKPGDSKDLEDALKGTKKAEKKLKEGGKIPDDESGEEVSSGDEGSKDEEKGFIYNEYGEKVGYQETEISKDKGSKDKGKEGVKIPFDNKLQEKVGKGVTPSGDGESTDKAKKGITTLHDGTFDKLNTDVGLDNVSEVDKVDIQIEKQKRTGKEIKRIGSMIGQGGPISEIQDAWTAFIKGADAGAIMPAINRVLQEAIQEAMRNAQHAGGTPAESEGLYLKLKVPQSGGHGGTYESEITYTAEDEGKTKTESKQEANRHALLSISEDQLKERLETTEKTTEYDKLGRTKETTELEPSTEAEGLVKTEQTTMEYNSLGRVTRQTTEVEYEGVEYEAGAIADITKMLYDTVVAIRGKDLPSDWYHVEAETSLELPKISAPPLDIEKQKLPTIKPPKVIEMPKTVERPMPSAVQRPPTAEGPAETPRPPGAGGTGRPSGGRR